MDKIIKINNKQEWYACQQYLFNHGYIWNGGENFINFIKSESYIICRDNKFMLYGFNGKYYDTNSIDFNKFMREKKLKRILK